jgi:hypothetical protein
MPYLLGVIDRYTQAIPLSRRGYYCTSNNNDVLVFDMTAYHNVSYVIRT